MKIKVRIKQVIILLISVINSSCAFSHQALIRDATSLNYHRNNLTLNDSFVINSISVLDRFCNNCKWRDGFPLEMTNAYGNKNIENIHLFINKFRQRGKGKVNVDTPIVNDSLFYYSQQEWTKRIWGKNPRPEKLNGNFLIVSYNFKGFLSGPFSYDGGQIRTIYEFIQLFDSEVTGYWSYTLQRSASRKNPLIRYKDIKKILKRFLQNK